MTATTQERFVVKIGRQYPLGATPDERGTYFSIFSPQADAVELLLFDAHDEIEPVHTVKLDARTNKTFQFWHVYVEVVTPGTHELSIASSVVRP